MKNIYSNIYSFNAKSLKKTIKSLKQGNLVGLRQTEGEVH